MTLPRVPQQIALQLIQQVPVTRRAMCLKIEKGRNMRIVNGLELRIVPAGIFSRATGPLSNAAINLEHQDVVVSMCWISMPSVSDHTTMSVRAMIVMGIGENCS
jgi:hypothetical protein